MVPQGYWQDGKYILIDGALEKKDAAISRLKKENEALREDVELQRRALCAYHDYTQTIEVYAQKRDHAIIDSLREKLNRELDKIKIAAYRVERRG